MRRASSLASPQGPPPLPTSREYLEKHYAESSGQDTLKLALRALTEVVEGSSKNIEVAVVEKETGLRFLTGEPRSPGACCVGWGRALLPASHAPWGNMQALAPLCRDIPGPPQPPSAVGRRGG